MLCEVGLREGIWHEAVAFTGCFVAALSLGTFVSAFTVLCGARTDLPDRHMCCVFWLNIAAALIQILTAIVMVGWIMSIFWGMDMVILASKYSALTSPTSPLSDHVAGCQLTTLQAIRLHYREEKPQDGLCKSMRNAVGRGDAGRQLGEDL